MTCYRMPSPSLEQGKNDMKHILALALLIASMGNTLGCGSSKDLTPRQACDGVIGAYCDWTQRCAGAAGATASGDYTSTADCTSKMQASACAVRGGDCPAGQTFHSDKAQQCIDAFASFSCTSTTEKPDVCNQVCQSESDAGMAKAVPEFPNTADAWYPSAFSIDMSDYWSSAGIPFGGMNYYLLTKPVAGNSWSERFNPDSKYFQAWLGVYTVSDSNGVTYGIQDGELDAKATVLLGVTDQINWLKDFAGIPSPIVKVDDTIPVTKEATTILGSPGWKITCRLKAQADTGDNNQQSGLPSLLVVPKTAWNSRISSNQEISLDICLYVWHSDQHGQLNVIYYNSTSFTDRSGNALDTKPAIFGELDAIARSITLE
jgi:hypothetical protein